MCNRMLRYNTAIVDCFAGSFNSRSSVEEHYQYSPLEVRNPKKTTIAVVTAAIRSPSISVSISLIQSLHNKKVQLKKHPQDSLFTLFRPLQLHRPTKAARERQQPFDLFTVPLAVSCHSAPL